MGNRMTAEGHFVWFPPPRPNGRCPFSCVRQVQQIGYGRRVRLISGHEQIPLFDQNRPSLRPDLPTGRAPRAAAVKDAAATAAAPAEPARSALDRASTVLG